MPRSTNEHTFFFLFGEAFLSLERSLSDSEDSTIIRRL
jgi:hypothetical protein